MLIGGVYVNDILIIAEELSVSNSLEELKEHEFNLKIKQDVVEYTTCSIIEIKHEGKRTIIQPHLLTCLTKNLTRKSKT
jgi:hypothetical protein